MFGSGFRSHASRPDRTAVTICTISLVARSLASTSCSLSHLVGNRTTTPPEARVRAHADNHTDTVTEERQTHTDRQNSWKHWCGTECITTHRIDYPSGFRWASVAHLSEAFSARRVAEAEFLSQLRCDSRFGSRRLLFDHRHTSMRYIPVPRSVIANVTFR